MIYKLFSIRDSKIDDFLPPFCAKTIGEAEREITDMLRDKNSRFARYSDDFCLFELGTFDSELGFVENLVQPKSLSILSSYCNVDPS